MSGGRDPYAEDLQCCQMPDHLQDRARYLRLMLTEIPMHRQQQWPPGPAPPRRALRGPGQELPGHLPLREGSAQEEGVGRASLCRSQRLARFTQVQAAQIREGEHRGAANRLRAEHKEVGRGSGSEPAEAGAGGSVASTGAGRSLPGSFDWSTALSALEQDVFQQPVKLRGSLVKRDLGASGGCRRRMRASVSQTPGGHHDPTVLPIRPLR